MKNCHVLLYHGVTAEKPNSGSILNGVGKHIYINDFKEQMQRLAEKYHVVPLTSVKNCKDNCVVITFDDSYRNVYLNAYPVLKKLGLPATMFLPTGFVGTKRNYWTDVLEHIIEHTKEPELIVNWRGKHRFAMRGFEEKKASSLLLRAIMKHQLPAERNAFLERLKAASRVEEAPNSSDMENIKWEEVKKMTDVFQFGGHGVNHEILSYLSPEELHKEVKESLDAMEAHGFGRELFSYPEGQYHHYSEEVIAELRKNGVKICPSAVSGVNTEYAPFHLKRIMVGFQNQPFPL